MDRRALIAALKNYETSYLEESQFIVRFLDLLNHPNAYQRDHLPGHLTGSAWIIDRSQQFVLLTHHAKLNRWLQPGGHADGEEDIISVAVKEAREETGLDDYLLLQENLFDIDVHTIPQRKDFPEHLHFDVRILLQGSKDQNLIVTDESHDLAWVPLDDIAAISGNNSSMVRMVEKTKALALRLSRERNL